MNVRSMEGVMEDRETYFEDLSPCLYFGEHFIGATAEKIKAVGWLAKGRPYPRRQTEMPETTFRQLLRLLEDPWEPCHCMGYHECRFCPPPTPPVSQGQNKAPDVVTRKFVRGVEFVLVRSPKTDAFERRHRIERDGVVIRFGANNLFVPGEGVIYVAPSMIAHYIDAHAYEPPAVFWEAVMKCPEMWSDAYGQALILNGPTNEKWKHVAGQMKSQREDRERFMRDWEAAEEESK